jgi:hypothetical protein
MVEIPSATSSELFTAKLDVARDCLTADNAASMIIPPVHRATILLVSTGSLFLERALNASGANDLYECSPGQYAQARVARQYDLTVFDGYLPDRLPTGAYLIFHALGADVPVGLTASSGGIATIVDWSQTHPIMRFVDLGDTHVADMMSVKPASWARTLVDTDRGPAIVASDRDGRRIVWVAFSLSDSDFPLKVSFPIFIQNVVDWACIPGAAQGTMPVGAVIPLAAGAPWTVSSPWGHASGKCSSDGDCVYAGAVRAGNYTVDTGSGAHIVAVSLLDERGSSVTSVAHGSLPEAASAPAERALPIKASLLATVASLALLLVVAEWAVYHRRR